jgi:hypothetical protein
MAELWDSFDRDWIDQPAPPEYERADELYDEQRIKELELKNQNHENRN